MEALCQGEDGGTSKVVALVRRKASLALGTCTPPPIPVHGPGRAPLLAAVTWRQDGARRGDGTWPPPPDHQATWSLEQVQERPLLAHFHNSFLFVSMTTVQYEFWSCAAVKRGGI